MLNPWLWGMRDKLNANEQHAGVISLHTHWSHQIEDERTDSPTAYAVEMNPVVHRIREQRTETSYRSRLGL
ncbi:hypothetical protein AAFF_G00011740 [Aldrovandia affinis]|uniref:Uncharacterized protein n=1 Tax=Aldrovandia affinis TaxID=143900 RepID=A0AAD7WH32_9TELE|nr:hypothetical protein AAFF_G00011740 [Aldrovandia affinis]